MRLRVFLAGLMLGIFVMAGASRADAPDFFTALPDIPLMTGMEELTEQTLVFDKPEGRIVESVASAGGVLEEEMRVFYAQTLPQLGWTKIAETSFIREGEILRLEFEAHEGQKFLKLMLYPKSLGSAP